MYEAGNADGTKDLASKAYARYDCTTETLCVLVMGEDNANIIGDTWFKVYDISNSAMTPTDSGIKYVTVDGKNVGWEGCFNVPMGTYAPVEIHANYRWDSDSAEKSRTTSTGKNNPQSTPIAMEVSYPRLSCVLPCLYENRPSLLLALFFSKL
jgi:hypothetical protein